MRELAAPIALIAVLVITPSALAESRTPPEATAHALDELANCHARDGAGYPAGYCPPPTPAPATATPVPSVGVTVTVTPPPPAEPTATPLPVLPVGGAGYTRPLDDHWLELVVTQGRWAIYQADDCDPRVGPWANVVTQVLEDGEVDLISETADCGLVAEQWMSDAPCSVNGDGVCDVSVDASFWDMLGLLATPTPVAPPLRAVTQPPARQSVAATDPQPQARTAVQTVLVIVTADPTDTPELAATQTPAPTQTPRPSLSATPTATATVSPTATGTPTVLAIGAVAGPTSTTSTVAGERQVGRWDWGGFLLAAVLVVVAVVATAWALTRRKVVRWGARPKSREDRTHAV